MLLFFLPSCVHIPTITEVEFIKQSFLISKTKLWKWKLVFPTVKRELDGVKMCYEIHLSAFHCGDWRKKEVETLHVCESIKLLIKHFKWKQRLMHKVQPDISIPWLSIFLLTKLLFKVYYSKRKRNEVIKHLISTSEVRCYDTKQKMRESLFNVFLALVKHLICEKRKN